jgi:hypothetical protein
MMMMMMVMIDGVISCLRSLSISLESETSVNQHF